MMGFNYEINEWQLAHIEKGLEDIRKGEFASDKEIEEFLEKYGDFSIENDTDSKSYR